VFDPGYEYSIAPMLVTTFGIDVNGTSSGSSVTDYPLSAGLNSTQFLLTANGSAWHISPMSAPGLCLDAGAGEVGTPITATNCSSNSPSLNWIITPFVQYGSFTMKMASPPSDSTTGRCMRVSGSNTSSGTPMVTDNCNAGYWSEMFAIQAGATL
jgi:hypothetical protein